MGDGWVLMSEREPPEGERVVVQTNDRRLFLVLGRVCNRLVCGELENSPRPIHFGRVLRWLPVPTPPDAPGVDFGDDIPF